jgi:aminoglycoside phosphotransferase
VYRFHKPDDALYLKITDADDESRRDYGLLIWLDGKLPVPQVRYRQEHDGRAYLLMTEVPGRMVNVHQFRRPSLPSENTVKLLVDGLRMLQNVDITDCPFDNTLDHKLAWALRNIEDGLVDWDDIEEENKFTSPMALYEWLAANRPPEDVTFTHGDYSHTFPHPTHGAATA